MTDNTTEFTDYIHKVLSSKEKICPTYFPSIDKAFRKGGLPPQCLFYIVGKANTGKTKLALNIIYRMLRYGKHKLLFFSLEEARENIWDNFIRLHTTCADDEELMYELAFPAAIKGNLKELGFFDRLRIEERSDNMFRAVEEWKPDVIFIDHLHLINLNQRFAGIYDKTEAIGSNLIILKKTFQTRVVCLVQRKRSGEKYPGAELPFFEDALGSGSIETATDVWMGICRPEVAPKCPEQYRREVHCYIRKNRYKNPIAEQKLIRLSYEPYSTRLYELDEKDTMGG